MALVYRKYQSVDAHDTFLGGLIQLLRDAGWHAKLAGGDGPGFGGGGTLAYPNVDPVLVTTNLYSHYFWLVMQTPGGNAWSGVYPGQSGRNIEFMFYKFNSAGPGTWYVQQSRGLDPTTYAVTSGFTGGTATQFPTAVGADSIHGYENDFAGPNTTSGVVSIFRNNPQHNFIGVADSSPPYGFSAWWYAISTGEPIGGMVYDPFAAGTYITTGSTPDHDPYVVTCLGPDADPVDAFLGQYSYINNAADNRFRTASWFVSGGVYMMRPVVPAFAPGTGANCFTGKDDLFNLAWNRDRSQALPTGWKGVTTLTKFLSTQRATADTLTVNTSRDFAVIKAPSGNQSSIAIPWDGSVPFL